MNECEVNVNIMNIVNIFTISMNIHAKRHELNVNEMSNERTGRVSREGPQSVNNWMKTARFIHVRSAVHEHLREGLTLHGPPAETPRAVPRCRSTIKMVVQMFTSREWGRCDAVGQGRGAKVAEERGVLGAMGQKVLGQRRAP